AMTGAIRKLMFQKPEEFDPRAFLKAATAAARGIVAARFEAFGCAGQASKIKVLPLAAMAQRYQQLDASLRQAA
ncbi:MAG: fructose-1,6-bisphosphate aldolase, partial [Burkholderiales bacterium]|nr:fructose-1,6-bisphosphate aldolase [Burkholderiales bacterium]